VVTDDFPCFIVPAQAEALARKAAVPVFAVDSNSVVPLSLLGPAVSAAAHLRPRIHKAFAEAWPHRAAAKPRVPDVATRRVRAPFDTWKAKDVAALRGRLPLDTTVPKVAGMPGGTPAARARLRAFLKEAAARVRGGALRAALARRGPRERPLAVPPLRPRLDRGGRRDAS
jgi:deoxyribodipyrimidine photo-lyase